MSGLLGPNGQPISSYKKAPAPKTGPSYGSWAGRNIEFINLPGGGLVEFDLSQLTLADFRQMRDHPQVSASQAVLTFMVHQADWVITSPKKKIQDHCQANMQTIWTRLVRAIGQSFWAGFSPNVLEWENDRNSGTVQLNKVKDLIPEECTVNWEEVEGAVTTDYPGSTALAPKQKLYNGIKQRGWPGYIPTNNSFWYPLMMENGNYYGRKLLRPAYQPWFFSLLIHLFSNRYFERFGEPVPIGRAPYEDEVEVNGETVKGPDLMETILTQLRNRSTVVLPNERSSFGSETASHPDYAIEYLESQMRGADFERYLTRLDEEISLAMFTPLLLLRTGDVGSYNLGVGHMQMYLWMLNALLSDLKDYIDRYILGPMVNLNFSESAPRATIQFRKLGKESAELTRAMMSELMSQGKVKPDIVELGQMVGMTLTEINETVGKDPDEDTRVGRDKPKRESPRGTDEPRATGKEISARMRGQTEKAFRMGSFGPGFVPTMGYRRRMEESLRAHGHGDGAASRAADLYRRMDAWLVDVVALGTEEFGNDPSEFCNLFDRMLDTEIERASAQ